MVEEKKKSILRWILNPEPLIFDFGKNIALLVGGLIIIERMIGIYINLPIGVKTNDIFNIGYMFGIVSIPIALSCHFLYKIFGEDNE